jgi:large conductance mechanosensitive channel
MDPLQKVAEFEPRKKAFSLMNEFKAFAFKGNVIDLAVGVIIGAAFGKIIESLVKDIFVPLIALIGSPEEGFKGMEWRGVKYGDFLSNVVYFLLVALILFIFIVKFVGWIMRIRREEPAAAPALTKDQELLTEIRDLIKNQARGPQGVPAGS